MAFVMISENGATADVLTPSFQRGKNELLLKLRQATSLICFTSVLFPSGEARDSVANLRVKDGAVRHDHHREGRDARRVDATSTN